MWYGRLSSRIRRCRRITSSKSSPIESVAYPPTSITASLRKMPNAPEMISSELIRLQPVRAAVKARRYSTVWNIGSHFFGSPIAVTCPRVTSQPLATRMIPAAAIVRSGRSMNGRTIVTSASGSSSESASTQQTSG